jgi:hypothetical protein
MAYLGLKSYAFRTCWISSLLSVVNVYRRTNLRFRAEFQAFLGRPPGLFGAIPMLVLEIGTLETAEREAMDTETKSGLSSDVL